MNGHSKGVAAIERVGANFRIRRKGKPAHPREEQVGMNHSVLSDRSLSGAGYPWLEHVRAELLNWRTGESAVGQRRYMPQTVTGAPSPDGGRRKIFSAQGRSGARSNRMRCPASAPQRSM